MKSFDPLTGAVLGGCWRGDKGTECPPLPPDGAIAAAAARLPAGSPALLRWIAATHADPLMLAVTDGAKLDDRTAVAASHGLVAVVDLASGGVREVLHYDERRPGDEARRSRLYNDGARDEVRSLRGRARREGDLWFFCPWTGAPTSELGKLQMPFGALSVHGGTVLTVKPVRAFASVGRDADHGLVRSSSAGGVLIALPCSFDAREVITGTCVRQPDGSFSSFSGAWGRHGFRTNYPRECLARARRRPHRPAIRKLQSGSRGAAALHVASLGPRGDVTEFPPLPIAFAEGSLVDAHGIDEDDMAGSWSRFRRKDRRGSCGNRLDGAPPTVREIQGASSIGLGGGHALAVVGEVGARVVISNDGGAHVFEEGGPRAAQSRPPRHRERCRRLPRGHLFPRWVASRRVGAA